MKWIYFPNNISIAICTFNRAELLLGAVESLCGQQVPVDCFEIIIIDNGSTDNTAKIVRECQALYADHTIRLIVESEQGLGRARTTALRHASGQYVAFIDDDARAPSDWMEKVIANLIDASQEELICLGGPIQPFYTSAKPAWFKDEYESRSWGGEWRRLREGESFSGSNMIWQKEKLVELGGFAEDLGVSGGMLSLGEETAVFEKAWRDFSDPIFEYDPTLVIEHWVPSYKMRVSYRLKRAFAAGQVAVHQRKYQHKKLYLLLGAIKGVMIGSLKAFWRFRKYPYWQNWAVEEGQPIMINLGTILAVCGIYLRLRQA